MKIAQLIASEDNAAEAMDRATDEAIATVDNPVLYLTKFIFEDRSVLVFRADEFFGFDAEDVESIEGYAAWLDADDPEETAEINRLLDAVPA